MKLIQLSALTLTAIFASSALANPNNNQTSPFPMEADFWNSQMKGNKSMKDVYNYNAKAWNDWFGNGKTRYRFYGDMDLQLELEMQARARAAHKAKQRANQNAAYQNWLNQQYWNQYYGQRYNYTPQAQGNYFRPPQQPQR